MLTKRSLLFFCSHTLVLTLKREPLIVVLLSIKQMLTMFALVFLLSLLLYPIPSPNTDASSVSNTFAVWMTRLSREQPTAICRSLALTLLTANSPCSLRFARSVGKQGKHPPLLLIPLTSASDNPDTQALVG